MLGCKTQFDFVMAQNSCEHEESKELEYFPQEALCYGCLQ